MKELGKRKFKAKVINLPGKQYVEVEEELVQVGVGELFRAYSKLSNPSWWERFKGGNLRRKFGQEDIENILNEIQIETPKSNTKYFN